VRPCPTCRHANPPDHRFCGACGAELGPATPPTPDAQRHPPSHLAEKIRQSKPIVEGERKQVTVLFADVKGSMELAEQLDPEAWSGIMLRFFRILADGVERFEGFVDKFTGDGIMALFGAPIAHEDHAQRACFAALHLRDELARYATEVKREHGVGFSTRMGINSGEVVVGTIGDDLRMTYTAQGHTVGLAQRMEALASPDTCYVTAATASLVGSYLQLEDLGDFRVKGAAEPMRVHRLVGAGTAILAGEPDLARAAVEHGVRMSESQGTGSLQGAHGRLGRQLLLDGRPAEAVEALEHALSFCSDGNRAAEPWLRQALAQAWLAAGDPARARAIAEDTLTNCLEIGARLVAIEAAVALSAALRAETGVAAAPRIDEVLGTADRLIAGTGACNLTPFVFVERAALSELRGDLRLQEECLRGAHEGFTRMGATGRARATAAALDRVAAQARS
jgi:class 3 adenylate cyclase